VDRRAVEGDRCELHFAVSDTGVGIPPEKLERLFQSFSQADASVTRRYGGTGLGLVICKNLVELMGGRISVESVPGRGASFLFTVSLKAGDNPAPRYLRSCPIELAGKRACLVGLTKLGLKLLLDYFRHWRMSAARYETIRQAREQGARDGPFDVWILDQDACTAGDLLDLPRPILELVPGGMPSRFENDSRVMPLTKPVRCARLYQALSALLNPEAVRVGTGRADQSPAPPSSDLRILLADDNTVNQKVCLLILESLGYRADVVSNGLEVLQALKRRTYDVVLMDVQMPEMDGWQASRRIRSDFPSDAQPWIIAMTAGILDEEREECAEAGMDGFVSKPIRPEELRVELEKRAAPCAPPTRDAGRESAEDELDGFDPKTIAALRAMNRPGSPDVVEELLVIYCHALPDQVKGIRQAARASDFGNLVQAAHKLRGSSANMGAKAMASACGRIEALAKKQSMDGVAELVGEIERMADRILMQQRHKTSNSTA
jgi:CheY-like chemotaxis protein